MESKKIFMGLGFLALIVVCLALGFLIGSLYTFSELGRLGNELIKDNNIQVNFNINETKLIQEFNKTIMPYIQNITNSTYGNH